MPAASSQRRAETESEYLQGALAYKEQSVAEATGQSARFLKVYDEYRKAPDVTRKRMYSRPIEVGGTDKIIVDTKSGQGVVPIAPADRKTQGRRRLIVFVVQAAASTVRTSAGRDFDPVSA